MIEEVIKELKKFKNKKMSKKALKTRKRQTKKNSNKDKEILEKPKTFYKTQKFKK